MITLLAKIWQPDITTLSKLQAPLELLSTLQGSSMCGVTLASLVVDDRAHECG